MRKEYNLYNAGDDYLVHQVFGSLNIFSYISENSKKGKSLLKIGNWQIKFISESEAPYTSILSSRSNLYFLLANETGKNDPRYNLVSIKPFSNNADEPLDKPNDSFFGGFIDIVSSYNPGKIVQAQPVLRYFRNNRTYLRVLTDNKMDPVDISRAELVKPYGYTDRYLLRKKNLASEFSEEEPNISDKEMSLLEELAEQDKPFTGLYDLYGRLVSVETSNNQK